MARACCSRERPAWVGTTPCRPRVRSGAPSVSSMLRMRVEAAPSARFERAAPWVMLPASTTCRNRLKSVRSKRMRGFRSLRNSRREAPRNLHCLHGNWSLDIRHRRSERDLPPDRRIISCCLLGRQTFEVGSVEEPRCAAAGQNKMAEAHGWATRPAARPLSPHMSIYRWPITMAMSIFHRVTGGALYFGMLLVAWWLIAVASGPNAYATFQSVASSWIGRLILFGYPWALLHHMLGGMRHLIWDTIHGLEPGEREWLAW